MSIVCPACEEKKIKGSTKYVHVCGKYLKKYKRKIKPMEQSNNTLPAEVVDEIKNKAEDFGYVPEREQVNASFNPDYKTGYMAGATEYATKLQELQEELKTSNHGLESYKKAFVEKVEWQDNAKVLLAEVFQKHESGLLPDRFIYEKIKTFLYGE